MKKLFFITLALVITSVASAQIEPNEAGYCRNKPVGTSCTVPSSSSSYGEHGTNGNYSGQSGSCETTTSRASNSSTNQSSTSSTENTGNSVSGNVKAEAKILGTGEEVKVDIKEHGATLPHQRTATQVLIALVLM